MSNINTDKRKRVNRIYNQCLIYTIIAGAISVPFLLPIHGKISNRRTSAVLTAPAPELVSARDSSPEQPPTAVYTPKAVTLKPSNTAVMATAMVVEKPVLNVPAVTSLSVKTSTKKTVEASIESPKIDSQFIAKMEGSVLKGYVPLPGKTKSGVTIATGFDLGQMRPKEFNNLPLSAGLKNKLRPYVGLKKFNAVAFLKSHPLSINQTELLEINQISMNKILQPLMKNYNKASKTSFTQLPKQAQTVLFSYAYQYGPDFMKKSSGSKLWHYFVTQDWKKVSATLRGSRQYSSRRRQEAQLINNLSYNDTKN